MLAETSPRRLIIFDVDGTLLDANAIDNGSFDRAFEEIVGTRLKPENWETFKEVTARAIVYQALPDRADLAAVEARVRDAFLSQLRDGYERDRGCIRAFDGVIDALAALQRNPNVAVAIATGCWRETAHFKLACAGVDISGIPFACSSDCSKRSEIIALAAERAGLPVEQAVYVGDGIWDLRATQELGIPFIATGARIEALRLAGARHALETWSEPALLQLLSTS